MNTLTKALLSSAAVSVLAIAPATAARPHPAFNVTALHAGKVINKTNMHNQKAGHITYTLGAYTYVSNEFHIWQPLTFSFYKWNSYSTLCSNPKQHMTFNPKKTQYGKFHAITQTYSEGCPSGPTTFMGAEYMLLKPTSQDYSVITLKGTFRNSNGKYKGAVNFDTNIFVK